MHSLQLLLHHARRVPRLSLAGRATDGQLLNRFRTARDDAAFELLVWRHGPMVLAVCRRVLGNEHAAEDAFQATFLTLALKSGSMGRGEAVGAWLYRVAYRVALRAGARDARRAKREQAAGRERAEQTPPEAGPRLELQELRPRLDAEIARLPEAYRIAFILCHLEGRTNEEAARVLGCPVGTIQSRLSRAPGRAFAAGCGDKAWGLRLSPSSSYNGTTFMSDNHGATRNRDALLENFAAEVTSAAYAVALRHGLEDKWLDLQLELWGALKETVKKWEQEPPHFSDVPFVCDWD